MFTFKIIQYMKMFKLHYEVYELSKKTASIVFKTKSKLLKFLPELSHVELNCNITCFNVIIFCIFMYFVTCMWCIVKCVFYILLNKTIWNCIWLCKYLCYPTQNIWMWQLGLFFSSQSFLNFVLKKWCSWCENIVL